MSPRTRIIIAAALAVLVAPGIGRASQLIDRNAVDVRIAVDLRGEALLTYSSDGQLKHVLAWGAVDAIDPSADTSQVHFHLDYAGGWGKYHTEYWKRFANACRPYTGPPIPFFVTGCTSPDGSYWAVQGFPQPLPDLGFTPWASAQRAVWLELSHWSGPLAKLDVWQGWIYNHRYQEIFGRLTYQGHPVYGFGTTHHGSPTDGFGRLIYLDTFNAPAYGTGWRRENSFVVHNPTGAFCYGFYPFNPTVGGYQYPPGQTGARGPGVGTRYRITAQGPGVTPDVGWEGSALGGFQPLAADRQIEAAQLSILHTLADKPCLIGHN
jgi:hypothetical protein